MLTVFKDINMADMIQYLEDTKKYKIIEKYEKPKYYHQDDGSEKRCGVFIDVETTGLHSHTDKIIELGMVMFEYAKDGRIFRITEEYSQYQDPGIPIPKMITNMTGITDDMVKNQHIDKAMFEKYMKAANIIISHNAKFDRHFLEVLFPDIMKRPWGCLMHNIDWKLQGIESHKLEYIAYRYGFFYEGHRAITDCLAGVHILSKKLLQSDRYVFTELLENCRKLTYKIWALGAPFETKDILKQRGYKWERRADETTLAWAIELNEDKVAEEIAYLRSDIFQRYVQLPIDILDACTRFSKILSSASFEKYPKEVAWLKSL